MLEPRIVTLGELLHQNGGSIKTGPFGTMLKANQYSTVGVPIISVGEVGDSGRFRVAKTTPRASDDVVISLPEYILREGDIVFARKGAVERSAWVGPDEDGWFLGSDGIRVRPGAGLNSRFLALQFQTQRCRRWLLQHASGSTMASLSGAILERLPVLIPDAVEQSAATDILGALNDKIAANLGLAATTTYLSSSMFDEVVLRVDPSSSAFEDMAVIGGGGTPRTGVPAYWEGNVLWATPTDVTALPGPYLYDTARRISDAGLIACSSPLYPAGSILMTSRATIGAFAVTAKPMAVNQGGLKR